MSTFSLMLLEGENWVFWPVDFDNAADAIITAEGRIESIRITEDKGSGMRAILESTGEGLFGRQWKNVVGCFGIEKRNQKLLAQAPEDPIAAAYQIGKTLLEKHGCRWYSWADNNQLNKVSIIRDIRDFASSLRNPMHLGLKECMEACNMIIKDGLFKVT